MLKHYYLSVALLSNLSWTPMITYSGLPVQFDVQGHRGARDARPENTLPAFAMAVGVTTLEMDMQITKDGHIVIRHSPQLLWYLTRNAAGQYVDKDHEPDVRQLTLEEVQTYDVGVMNPLEKEYYTLHGKTQQAVPGTKVPTLEEVFKLVRDWDNKTVRFNIETKSYPDDSLNPCPEVFVKKFYDIVKRYGMEDRVMLQSFDWRTLVEMKRLDPRIPTVALTSEQPDWGAEGIYRWMDRPETSPWMAGLNIHDFNGDYVKAAHTLRADVISPYYEELTPELIKEAHQFGMKVVPWTVNHREDMQRLIGWGVDGLITDQPTLLLEVLRQKNSSLAAPSPVRPDLPYYTGIHWGDEAKQTEKATAGTDAAR